MKHRISPEQSPGLRVTATTPILVGLLLLSTVDARAQDVNLARDQRGSVFSSLDRDGWSAARLTDGETDTGGWSSKAFAANADHRL